MASSREAVRRHYDGVASGYDARNRLVERRVLGAHRAWLGRQAAGRTLELGVGTGFNLAHYRSAQVIGIDLSEAMLAGARQKGSALLVLADAGHLPFPRAAFDTVATTLVLSAVPDPHEVIREAHRVLRPRGGLLAIEKTRSNRLAMRLLQRALGRMWRRIQGGDRLGEDLIAALDNAGFATRIDGWFAAGLMARIDARRRD